MSAAKYLASKVDHEAEGLELRAERDEALKALAGSRARFADSEARRAELEAVIEKAKWEVGRAGVPYVERTGLVERILKAAPSVVLEDRDREVAAQTLENASRDLPKLDGTQITRQQAAAAWLDERAAAIRKGDTA